MKSREKQVTLTLGEIDKLPDWATYCQYCGIVHAEAVECPVCSQQTESDQR